MIGVVDYGRGNLHSVLKALDRVGAPARSVSSTDELGCCNGLVVPGVGAFADAMSYLELSGLAAALVDAASAGLPILGICLGMQIMLSTGQEGGDVCGLDLIPGKARALLPGPGVKVPHTGWNGVRLLGTAPLMAGIASGAHFYFVHSYAAFPKEPAHWQCETVHGRRFASVMVAGNVMGVQFHPEKSGDCGLRVLANFARLAGS